MRLSKRGEYGLRAMIYIAQHTSQGDPIPTREIAENEGISEKFLEQILKSLKNAGLLHSRRGVSGGYILGHPADQIFLGQVERIPDGPLAPIPCVSEMAYAPCSCPDEATCGLRMVMFDVRKAVVDILDHTSLADVTRRLEILTTRM